MRPFESLHPKTKIALYLIPLAFLVEGLGSLLGDPGGPTVIITRTVAVLLTLALFTRLPFSRTPTVETFAPTCAVYLVSCGLAYVIDLRGIVIVSAFCAVMSALALVILAFSWIGDWD